MYMYGSPNAVWYEMQPLRPSLPAFPQIVFSKNV